MHALEALSVVRRARRSTALAVLLLAAPLVAQAQTDDSVPDEEFIRQSYVKFEHRIPMRDGVHLFTAVYEPLDRSAAYPILLFRTPYSCRPYGADQYRSSLGPNMDFARDRYIFVYQDVRGRYLSEGEFRNMTPHVAAKEGPEDVDESTDTYDTIEWLLEHVENHNGRVGQWGISYPGFYTSAGMIDSHPALRAASPQAPIADWFWDDFHHHGAFFLPHAFNFLARFGKPRPEPTTETPPRFDHGTPDGYDFFLELGPLRNADERHFQGSVAFWNELAAHPNYDEFWQSRNILPHLSGVRCAVLTVGGWFDAEDLYGPLESYRAIERMNPGIENAIVMGPWAHGGWNRSSGDRLGNVAFGFETSRFYRERIERPFFRHHLKGEGDLDLPEAWMFETGANRWRRFDEWPPAGVEARTLYAGPGGTLTDDPPRAREDSGYDEFVSDPAKPVPYTEDIRAGMTREYMTDDQRFAARRPDVLVYETEPLAADLTVAGALDVELFVSTSESAADWVVKLIDVHPGDAPDEDAPEGATRPMGGYQMMVRSEVIRGRFRESYERPRPFRPGEITRVPLRLLDVLHTFRAGHRVMIQVQSTWFPLVDRNPQKWVPNIFEASERDFRRATHRVYRSRSHASGVRFATLPPAGS